MTTVICPNCQKENPAGSRFCNNCGARLPAGGTTLAPDVPGWLQAAEQADVPNEGDDLAWMEDLELTGLGSPPVQPALDSQSAPPVAAVVVSPASPADLPNWLVELTPRGTGLAAPAESSTTAGQPTPTPAARPDTSPEQPLAAADLPDWVADLAPLEAATTTSLAGVNFLLNALTPANDLPDWLTTLEVKGLDLDGVLAEVTAAPIPPALPTGDGAKAADQTATMEVETEEWETPEWVQQLKPGAEASPTITVAERPIDIEPVIVAPHEPTQRPSFRATLEQEQQAALLRRVAEAAESPPAPERIPSLAFSPRMRLVLGVLLLAAAGMGLWRPVANLGLSGLTQSGRPPAAQAAQAAFLAAQGRPVLVAFDYTPALAGELDSLVEPVLAELETNSSPVVAISQYAAGLPVAGRWLDTAAAFLPGEAVGLRALAACLGTGEPCAPPLGQVWDTEQQQLWGQVALVVIFTGDRDSLVNWIEQVGAAGRVPLVMGVTQALAPVATPYLSSGRLVGLIEGLPAATAFQEEQAARSSPAAAILESQVWLNGLVIFLLLASNFYYLMKREP